MSSIPYAVFQSSLRFWLPYVAIAAICLAAGMASLILSVLRGRDRLLLWVGVQSVLYGGRLAWENDLVRHAFGMIDVRWPIEAITFVIVLPMALFFREFVGRGWKSSIHIWVYVQAAFAMLGILLGSIAGYHAAMNAINGYMVIASVGLVIVNLLARKWNPRPVVLFAGLGTFIVLVIANNLGFGNVPFPLEPFGFLALIASLAYTAAQRALTNEKRLAQVDSELATARRIQSSILPRTLPQLADLRVAAAYHPMTEVAGDFYDFLQTSEHEITLLIADVSGHGVPAALIASMLKVAFAQQSAHAGDPAAILSGMNRILSGVLDGQFVTAACAHIDLAANRLTYSGAGHPPALLRRASGEVTELAENGLFLGPFRHAVYQNLTAPFDRGDRFLLYTDGIIEATYGDGEPFGPERLRQFFAAAPTGDPMKVAGDLISVVSRPEQEDDLTVVVAAAC